MPILKGLERIARSPDKIHGPLSPRLFDENTFSAWRRNLLTSGDKDTIHRYSEAIQNPRVRKVLDLDIRDGNHGS